MSLAQIGEFSFIIASVGVAAGVIAPWIYPAAIAVSAITTLTTPLLIRLSNKAAAEIDHWLPEPIQTVAALYASWIERVRSAPRVPTERSATRRIVRIILIDAALLTVLVIGIDLEIDRVTAIIGRMVMSSPERVRFIVVLVGGLMAIPLIYGIITRALAQQMASTDPSQEETKLEDVNAVLPGLGEPVAIRVMPESIAVGRSLTQLNLRGATGATVLAIKRGDQQIPTPLGREVIHANDILAVAGAQDSIAVARALFSPSLSKIKDDAEGAEIQAEFEALNDALLAESSHSTKALLP